MKQITIQVQDDQQVEQIKDVLANFDFIKSIDKEIQIHKAERERYYRALAAERERQIPSVMTPERVALKARLAESRRKREAV